MGRFSRLRQRLALDPLVLSGAARALEIGAVALALILVLVFAVPNASLERLLGTLAALALALIAAAAALLLTGLLRRGPIGLWRGTWLVTALIGAPLALMVAPVGLALLIGSVVAALACLGAGAALMRAHTAQRGAGLALTTFGTSALIVISGLLLVPGWDAPLQWTWTTPRVEALELEDPAAPGPFTVRELTYGSGHDRHREEYASGAALRTLPVDASKLVKGWSGMAGWARTRYWGFDASALPLQGRMWYPEGEGPFPIVLIVHGNHDMEDFSDGGYAYLGELFASRGYVTVSIDQNFLNSSMADLLGGFDGGLEKENDVRGWLLLEHLRQMRTWNASVDNPFHGKLDLDRVVLIGHSRGGEAAAEAALFNRLPVHPDDGRVAFDYGFGVRGVIAIAPADGQYDPRARPTRLSHVDYLVLQGSHDGDVSSFMGSSQYARVSLADCVSCFKAAIYLIGANHGQFNTRWGRADLPAPFRQLLNLVPIMDADAQRRVAKVLFSAFLESTFDPGSRYRAFLAEPAAGAAWTGDGIAWLTDFQEGRAQVIADFEEDDDLGTGSRPGVRIETSGLTRWRELDVPLKWRPRDSAAVLVGWDRADDDTAPTYRFILDQSSSGVSQLAFSLAMSGESPLADDAADWEAPDAIDFTIELTDRSGHSASLPLSTRQSLAAPVSLTTRKFGVLDGNARSEPILQRFAFPLATFEGVDAGALAEITLHFDRSAQGAILLDDVVLTP
jgi:dienelactone hydrolase